jgi:hypothetical protein
MTISELIAELEAIRAEHGDVTVLLGDQHITIDPWAEVMDMPITIERSGRL